MTHLINLNCNTLIEELMGPFWGFLWLPSEKHLGQPRSLAQSTGVCTEMEVLESKMEVPTPT
jgi:hypothetical protein